ncbi:MAG: hypothetical protein OXC39_03740 [Candidatus Dadabacteria bacterium]|nr:hypothetical protein [Candidatus Dadabacteria bacterium]
MADTLCFIPCCKKKAVAPDRQAVLPTLNEKRIPETWQKLQTTRNRMGACVDEDIRPRIALRQYDGGFYNSQADFRENIACNLNAGWLDLYIISAGYGIVHALDPIHPYEAEMKGGVATLWRDMGLSGVISELICVSRARRVFGFFAGPSHWSGAHAKYRYFFTEGVKTAIADGATLDTAACFYRGSGMGTNAITGALGRTLLRGLRSDFSSRFLAEYETGWADGNIVIRSENLLEIQKL